MLSSGIQWQAIVGCSMWGYLDILGEVQGIDTAMNHGSLYVWLRERCWKPTVIQDTRSCV